MGWPFRSLVPAGITIGLAFGVCFGISMACMFKEIIVRVDVTDPPNFLSQLTTAMRATGFKPAMQNDDSFVYKPTPRCGLLTREIWGEWNQDEAAIVGPAFYVKKVLTQLVCEQKRSLRT